MSVDAVDDDRPLWPDAGQGRYPGKRWRHVDGREVEAVIAAGLLRHVMPGPGRYSEQVAWLQRESPATDHPTGDAVHLQVELPDRVRVRCDEEAGRRPLFAGVVQAAD